MVYLPIHLGQFYWLVRTTLTLLRPFARHLEGNITMPCSFSSSLGAAQAKVHTSNTTVDGLKSCTTWDI